MCVAKPVMVGSPVGSLTHHGGSPVVSKPSEGKAADLKSPGGLGTGDEAWRDTDPGAEGTVG